MKRIHKIAGLLTLSACLLCACNDNADEIKYQPSNVQVELKVAPTSLWGQPSVTSSTSRGVTGPSSTGPLNSWYNTPVHMAYREGSGNYQLALTGNVHGSMTTFAPQLFYPNPTNTVISMKGFYPRAEGLTSTSIPAYGGKTAEGIVGNEIHYTIDGSYDISVSNSLSGSGDVPISGYLTYYHLLTQFSFVFAGEGSFPATALVRRIVLNNVAREVTLNLVPDYNDVGHTDPSYPLTFAYGTLNDTIVAFNHSTGIVVPNSGGFTPVGNVMFQPAANNSVGPGGPFSISVFIATANAATGLVEETEYTVTNLDLPDIFGNDDAKAGYHYQITLTFKTFATGPAITATATIVTVPPVEWPDILHW